MYYELLSRCTINTDIYCQQLRRLANAIQEKRPTRLREVMLLDDNALSHSAYLTKNTIQELRWEVIPHPPYSPDLAPSHFTFSTLYRTTFKELSFRMKTYSEHGLLTSTQNHAISTGAESKNYSGIGRML